MTTFLECKGAQQSPEERCVRIFLKSGGAILYVFKKRKYRLSTERLFRVYGVVLSLDRLGCCAVFRWGLADLG